MMQGYIAVKFTLQIWHLHKSPLIFSSKITILFISSLILLIYTKYLTIHLKSFKETLNALSFLINFIISSSISFFMILGFNLK